MSFVLFQPKKTSRAGFLLSSNSSEGDTARLGPALEVTLCPLSSPRPPRALPFLPGGPVRGPGGSCPVAPCSAQRTDPSPRPHRRPVRHNRAATTRGTAAPPVRKGQGGAAAGKRSPQHPWGTGGTPRAAGWGGRSQPALPHFASSASSKTRKVLRERPAWQPELPFGRRARRWQRRRGEPGWEGGGRGKG